MTKGIRRDDIKTSNPELYEIFSGEEHARDLTDEEQYILDDVIRACEDQNDGCVLASYKGIDPGSCDERLYEAARRYDIGLTDKGYDWRVQVYDDYLESHSIEGAVTKAVAEGKNQALGPLIKAGADVNKDQGLLLFTAIAKGHQETAQILIDHGADVETPRSYYEAYNAFGEAEGRLTEDETRPGGPLRLAIDINNAPMVSILIQAGADVNANDGEPLRMAGANDFPQVAEVLMNHGAEPTLEIAEQSRGSAQDLIKARYEQDLLRRHVGQVSPSEGLSQTPQPSRRQRL
jgi:hypothetical protein